MPIVALEPDKFDRAQENGHCDATKLSLNNHAANLLAWYRINNLLIKTESDIEQGLSWSTLGSRRRINTYTHRLYERTLEKQKKEKEKEAPAKWTMSQKADSEEQNIFAYQRTQMDQS